MFQRFQTLIYSILLLLAVPAGAVNRQDCDLLVNPENHQVISSIEFGSHEFTIYSKGTRAARRLLFLSAPEYEQLVHREDIDPDVVIVIDRLPLHLDLPVVKGIIMSAPLGAEGTHIQVLAEKMGIPLVQVHEDVRISLKNLRPSKFVIVRVNGQNSGVGASDSVPDYIDPPRKMSVLPISADRSKMQLVRANRARDYKLYEVGGKFMSLADLKNKKNLAYVPDIYALTSGFYEHFLDNAVDPISTQPLRQFIRGKIGKLTDTSDYDEVRSTLESIRSAINNATIDLEFFKSISDLLIKAFGSSLVRLSIRSNNEIEDLIGAGVFNSAATMGISPSEVKSALLKVWASIYTFRAYSIIKASNLLEENLSMPLLVHEYIDTEAFSGTASFSHEARSIKMVANVAIGNGAKATNPDANTKTIQIEAFLSLTRKKRPPLLTGARQNPEIEAQIIKLFESMRLRLVEEFTEKPISPSSVEIEFLGFHEGQGDPNVLQYKPRFSREFNMGFLDGTFDLEDFVRRFAFGSGLSGRAYLDALKLAKIGLLSDVGFSMANDFCRYAILEFEGQRRIIIWQHLYHEDVQKMIERLNSKAKWLIGGYVNFDNSGNLRFRPESGPTFVALTPFASRIFIDALEQEMGRNPSLLSGIRELHFYPSIWSKPKTFLVSQLNPKVLSEPRINAWDRFKKFLDIFQ